jgi:UDP-N-acetyl-D-galactosamine dehydrogenase
VVHELESYGIDVHVHDPVTDSLSARHEYGLDMKSWDDLPRAHAIIVAVGHKEFLARPIGEYLTKVVDRGCFIDVKSLFDVQTLERAGLKVWRL